MTLLYFYLLISIFLVLFDYNGRQIRIIKDDKGEPWFVAKDVSGILGYRDAFNASWILDADEKATHFVSTPGGEQNLIIINEPGLYNLILRSDKPEAKPFKRWVTHEVLPQIRETGGYIPVAPEMRDAEIMAKALYVTPSCHSMPLHD